MANSACIQYFMYKHHKHVECSNVYHRHASMFGLFFRIRTICTFTLNTQAISIDNLTHIYGSDARLRNNSKIKCCACEFEHHMEVSFVCWLFSTKSPFLIYTGERETETMDDIVIKQLTPMFPQLTPEVIRLSVQHVSNRGEPLNEGYLLQRCIDDLLELRTYSLETTFEGPQDGR